MHRRALHLAVALALAPALSHGVEVNLHLSAHHPGGEHYNSRTVGLGLEFPISEEHYNLSFGRLTNSLEKPTTYGGVTRRWSLLKGFSLGFFAGAMSYGTTGKPFVGLVILPEISLGPKEAQLSIVPIPSIKYNGESTALAFLFSLRFQFERR